MKKRIFPMAMLSVVVFALLVSPSVVRVHAAPTWTVTLVAKLGSYSSTTVLGVANDATDDFDAAYDAAAAPAPPIGVFSYFDYPSNAFLKQLSTSIIPPSGNMVWPLVVQAVATSGTMVLNWTSIPGGYSAYIKDATGTTILADMTTQTQYSYSAGSNVLVTFQVNFVIPEFPIGAIIALAACFVSYGALKGLRRFSYRIV